MVFKKIVAWPLSWMLYYLGHLVSLPMHEWESMGWLYPSYNTLMSWSCELSLWADLDVWIDYEED